VGPGPWSYEWLNGKCLPEVYHNDCNISSKGQRVSVLKEGENWSQTSFEEGGTVFIGFEKSSKVGDKG
jgi:hypothetical protein